MQHNHESLSPYTFDRGGDETGTYTHQQQFAQRLRGVLGRINAVIREVIAEEKLFNPDSEALVDKPREDIFDFPTDRAKQLAFLRWLREQLDQEFLNIVGPDRNQFIRAAYIQGIRQAHQSLNEFDVSFDRPDMDDLVSRPIHRSSLQTLYERTYEDLEGLRDDIAQEVREELTQGFVEGKSTRKIAKGITDRVDSVGKHRSTLIARSEVMNAYSEGTLTRAEELNRTAGMDIGVTHGVWNAANDARVCPFCRMLNGTPLTVNEMRNNTASFEGIPYRLKPPAHPQGRCRISLRPGMSIDTPLSERLPGGISL